MPETRVPIEPDILDKVPIRLQTPQFGYPNDSLLTPKISGKIVEIRGGCANDAYKATHSEKCVAL